MEAGQVFSMESIIACNFKFYINIRHIQQHIPHSLFAKHDPN